MGIRVPRVWERLVVVTFGVALVAGSLSACGAEDLSSVSGELVLTAPAPVLTNFGDPLPGLSQTLLDRFDFGADVFGEVETVSDGLGPVFNGKSCGECHASPDLGGTSRLVETRFGRIVGGVFDGLVGEGGSLIQTTGIGADVAPAPTCPVSFVAGETVPADATIRAGRRTTPLFGLGLIDAVPDATLEALATSQIGNADGVHGQPNHVLELATGLTRVGRFGWKSQVPTVEQFSSDAYLNEMGITSRLFPHESCPQGHCDQAGCDGVPDPEDDGTDTGGFTDFMRLLAPPPQRQLTGQAQAGANLFTRIGCATCHVPDLTTGVSDIPQLDHVTFHPYSDFLVHDMGALGDGITQGDASGTKMRTAALWGVSAQPFFLHDGRATTLSDAIFAHAGEATAAKNRFVNLSSQNQSKVLDFLRAL